MQNPELVAYLKYCWKSIAAFIALLLTNVFTRWVTNGEPLPTDTKGWVTFAVTVIGGTWLVWSKSNGPKPTAG